MPDKHVNQNYRCQECMQALSAANAPNQHKNISTQAVDQPTSTPPNVSAHIEHMLFSVYLIIYCDLLGFL